MQNDLEPVAVHPPAGVARRDLGKPVGCLEAEAAPEVDLIGRVQVRPLVTGAANADGLDPGHGELPADPAGQVLVRGDLDLVVEVPVVEGVHADDEGLGQGLGLPSREGGPVARELGADAGDEAVAVQAPGAVPLGENGDAPGGLEGGGGQVEDALGHGFRSGIWDKWKTRTGEATDNVAPVAGTSTWLGPCPGEAAPRCQSAVP